MPATTPPLSCRRLTNLLPPPFYLPSPASLRSPSQTNGAHLGTVLFLSHSAVLMVMLASIERAISYSLAAEVLGWAKAVVCLTELLAQSR